jgi:predicted ester cyclase
MHGFDPEFKDLRDFILKITYRIWEERGIDRIRDYYNESAPVKTPLSVTNSVEDVVRFTRETLQMFPDRQLYGEDVIGVEHPVGTYYSSHRILSTMTHEGDGVFGLPTGKKVMTRIIADCICRENQVIDEWMVRDQSAILLQLGMDPETFGEKLAQADQVGGIPVPEPEALVARWAGPPDSGPVQGDAKRVADSYQAVWEDGDFDALVDTHDRAYQGFAPGAELLYGIDGLINFLTGMRAAIPDGVYQVYHWIEQRENEKNPRIALRWSVSGTHSGDGRFGSPTGSPVVILAMSHLELQRGFVVREYHGIDELSIWAQIAANKH